MARRSPRAAKPLPMEELLTPECFARFFAKTERSGRHFQGGSACLLWTGGRRGGIPAGRYGAFWAGGRVLAAHRVALAMFLGRDLVPGTEPDHSCVQGLCVNPLHLEEVHWHANARRRPSRDLAQGAD